MRVNISSGTLETADSLARRYVKGRRRDGSSSRTVGIREASVASNSCSWATAAVAAGVGTVGILVFG
jgi:hypothetical protein